MSYFNNFPTVNYRFGTQASTTVYQNLSVYIDLLDQIKDDASFYTEYNIQDGDRADQTSQKLYNRTDLHWTFPFLNDNIKLNGWPRAYKDLVDQAKKDYPHTTITTRSNINNTMKVGTIVEGKTSGQRAKIVKRIIDEGQLIVDRVSVDRTIVITADVTGNVTLDLTTTGEKFTELSDWIVNKNNELFTILDTHLVDGGEGYSFAKYSFGILNAFSVFTFNTKVIQTQESISFTNNETISAIENGIEVTAVVDSTVPEYLSIHHCIDATKEGSAQVDINPNAPYVQRVTFNINLSGPSESQINASEITSVTISKVADYTQDFDLTTISTNIDKGFFTLEGGIITLGIQATASIADTATTTTFSDLLDIFTTSFPSGTDQTKLRQELYAELATAANNDTTAKVSIFFIVDNQLNISLSNNVFSVVYQYNIGATTVYVSNNIEGNTTTTLTPAATNQSEAWLEVVNTINTYISSNLTSFVPANLIGITYLDRYIETNNDLKKIKIIRPEVIDQIETSFQKILLASQAEEQAAVLTTNVSGTSTNVTLTRPAQATTGATVPSVGTTIPSSGSGTGGGYY